MGAKRRLLVHYHFFKNAGTSLDRMLGASFPGAWAALENPGKGVAPAELAAYIEANPKLHAISSHGARFPVPVSDRFEIFPLVILRNPIDRLRSAYLFERGERRDVASNRAAKEMDFSQYVEHFLEPAAGTKFRNFQVEP